MGCAWVVSGASKITDFLQAWFYGEGLKLPVEMEYDLTLAKQAYDLATRWDASRSIEEISELDFKESDLKDFNSNQISRRSTFW